MNRFWNLESLGIMTDESSVHQNFCNTITFKDDRYQVKLPWRDELTELCDNFELSKNRLVTLLKRLHRTPELLQEYDNIIREQIHKQIVEPVKMSKTQDYIPHHPVIRTDKSTTKIRIVYDASAKGSNGLSLNNCLHKGPKFDQNIINILLRFRVHRIAFSADIEKAFLMVGIAESDRDVLRFLWVKDIHSSIPEIVLLRFTRVVFGVTASPFLLNATISHHLNQYREVDPDFVEKLSRSMYVDDVVTGADNYEEAYKLYERSESRLSKGGFKLRKFISNSSELTSRISGKESRKTPATIRDTCPDDISYAKSMFESERSDSKQEQRVLGVLWNTSTDKILLDFRDITQHAEQLEPTKRNMASLVAKIYDPLGFVTPITVRLKILLQLLCKAGVPWDQVLTDELLEFWKEVIAGFSSTEIITVDRCYFTKESNGAKYSLQGFCDASSKAYAAVIYLLIESDGENSVRFVAAKSRVAPLSNQTIPRLELLSCLLLARLMSTIYSALEPEINLHEPTYYTDSQVALCWIKGTTKQWKQFVENRTQEIRRLTSVNHWKHCRSEDNPADIPSRGSSIEQLKTKEIWWNGPSWLTNIRGTDVVDDISEEKIDECLIERKEGNMVINLLVSEENGRISNAVDIQRFSSLSRLYRVTMYLLKFVKFARKESVSDQELLSEAERLWLLDCQVLVVSNPKYQLWKSQFGLFIDDAGLIRCRGRLGNADLPYDMKYPVLLDSGHPLCKLIVIHCHETVKHNGVNQTLTQLRSKFWIVKGRSVIKKIIRHCFICLKLEGAHYKLPPPPPLPASRVNRNKPFSIVGIDFAGPLYINTVEKVWICLYTCAIIRAIHLDLVRDLSAKTFINSFRRFSSRRGLPQLIISDNGRTFKSAATIIRKLVASSEVKEHFHNQRIHWTFNLERAPWWGGFFERMVKSVKRCLKKTLGNSSLTYDELLTVLVEIEMVLNSRPLSFVSSNDLQEPLTPSHLLTGHRLLSLPPCNYPEDFDYNSTIQEVSFTKRMAYFDNLLNHFWKRWQSEYLIELRECHRYQLSKYGSNPIPPSVGDIVLIHDQDRPRGQWRLAIVQEILSAMLGELSCAQVPS